MQLPIYLDYMATTPLDPRVMRKMLEYLELPDNFGNPSSNTHRYGWMAQSAVEHARQQVATLVGAEPREIIWTSGATESNNLAIKGAARFYQRKGKHIITCKTEHKAVLDVCAQLAREGFEVTYLTPQTNGLIDLQALAAALRPDTVLVSIMHANNEIGVIQDLIAIGELTKAHGALLHVDAAQSAGKTPIDLQNLPVDLMSFSAHKLYGPKGIGALFVRHKPRVRLEPLLHGGGQELGLRPGTLATHQIAGMGEAFAIAQTEMSAEILRVRKLRDTLWQTLQSLPEIHLNGDYEQRLPGNLSVSFGYVEGESLLLALQDLAVSSGSACTSATIEPSYVLRALGRDDVLAHSTVRFSLGRFTTGEEIDFAGRTVVAAVERLRNLSPLWGKRE
jgi:cysteine desulfurase